MWKIIDKGVYLHAFTDGRDVDPKSGKGFVERIEKKLTKQWATRLNYW